MRIEPYSDLETNDVLKKLLSNADFNNFIKSNLTSKRSKFLSLPGSTFLAFQIFKSKIKKINTIDEFQSQVKLVLESIIKQTIDEFTFSGIEKEIKSLAIKARDGEMSIEDMEGGTFTISNGGVFGSMLSTPILNPPQSSILGMHNIIERPIAVNGKVEIHPMMYLALSYDHRIIDGKESVGFLLKIKEALENPIEILMNNNLKKSLEI